MASSQLPLWAENVLSHSNAIDLKFLKLKRINVSDLLKSHKRFCLDDKAVDAALLSYLTFEEKVQTWKLSAPLRVSVYIEGGEKVELRLVHSPEKRRTVLKGNETNVLQIFSNLRAGDKVGVWMFRHLDDKKKEVLSFIFVKVHEDIFGAT